MNTELVERGSERTLPTPAHEVDTEQQRWRERTLRGLLWAGFSAIAFAAAWFSIVQHRAPHITGTTVAFAILLGVVALAKGLPFTIRALILFGSLHIACTVSIAVGGFSPNAFVGFATAVILASLLFGRNTGFATIALVAATLILVALGHRSGVIVRMDGWAEIIDSTSLSNLVRMIGVFVLLTGAIVAGTSYGLERSQELLLQKARSLEALQREQVEKERLRRDLERREAAFRKAQELEILGRLAGSTAHDFNNALVVIWAAIDELSHLPGLPEGATAALSSLRQAADQATATSRGLHAFGPMGPRRAMRLELGPLIARARVMLSRVLPVNIELQAEVDVDAEVLADEGELLRVLTNLVLNGRDAMRDGGRLTLRVRSPRLDELAGGPPGDGSSFVAIDVTDTGTGMSDDVKEHLFEPFFTTKQGGGTGLGLFSVRDVVEAAGGRVTVESELGKGTTVSLLFPQPTSARSSGRVPAGTASASLSGKGISVLVVDDDPEVLRAIKKNLTQARFTVLEATDAASALVVLRRHKEPIHVLCTDCMMPGLPVHHLIEGYRELHQGRVLLCSGYAPSETGISLELVDDFLPKPFGAELLVERVLALALAVATPRPAAP